MAVMSMLRILFYSLLSMAFVAYPAASQTSMKWECESNSLVRHVELNEDMVASPVCEVWYDKSAESGSKHRLWSANNDSDYCRVQVVAFIENLEAWGWQCTLYDAMDEKTP